jgi:hypothetical protein
MFKFKGKSPQEQFSNLVKIWFLVVAVTLCGAIAGFKLDAPYTEKTSHNATLELAYSSMQNCGHKGRSSCEEFMGRFKADDGKMYDREIDGFFYHRFVDGGRKPMDAYLTLSLNQQGVESPGYIKFLMSMSVLFGFMFIGGGLGLLFGGIDVEYEQRRWEREQEAREREERFQAKWGNS